MLALKGSNHIVRGTVGGLAHQARVSTQDCQRAIDKLSNPDPDGMEQPEEGRRIRPVEHGWFIINGEAYRERRSDADRKEYQKLYHREYRRKQSVNKRKQSSTQINIVNPSDQIRSEADKNKSRGRKIAERDSPQVKPLTLETLIEEFKPIYPWVDFQAETAKIRGWMIANPGKRKLTRRFLNNWLSRVDRPATFEAGKKEKTLTPEIGHRWKEYLNGTWKPGDP